MNEIEIIRSQLAVEQAHAAEVIDACGAVFGTTGAAAAPTAATALFREACVNYLVWVLARFEQRDQALAELLALRPSPSASGAAANLSSLIARPGTSREALLRLEAALGAGDSQAAHPRWQEFARFFNSAWAPRRAALEGAVSEHLGVVALRAVCAIDADSILYERNCYARVLAQLPSAVELRRTSSAASDA